VIAHVNLNHLFHDPVVHVFAVYFFAIYIFAATSQVQLLNHARCSIARGLFSARCSRRQRRALTQPCAQRGMPALRTIEPGAGTACAVFARCDEAAVGHV